MKILYGVQGTGNGHISRARAMAEAFATLPEIEVQFLFSGRPDGEYFDMEVFGDYWVRRGLTFISQNGKVDAWKTLRHNRISQLIRDVRQLDLAPYDLVISDFEPVTAHAARRQRKASLSISHQSSFAFDVPKSGEKLLDKVIMRCFAPTERQIGLHWYHFEQPILPPIIDITALDVARNDSVLVYLPFENLDAITEILRHFPSQQFVCFHPSCQAPNVRGNIAFYPLGKKRFSEALASCGGVIANGGFELPSEALFLGKKLLLKPLDGQFEQQSNVATLDLLGLATCMDSLDIGTVREWLDTGEAYRVFYPDVASALAKWIAKGDIEALADLRQQLWSQVSFPEHVNDLLSDSLPTKGRKRALLSMRLPVSSNNKLKVH